MNNKGFIQRRFWDSQKNDDSASSSISFSKKSGAGFTLIEVLIVVAIIGILAAMVIVALNPGRQFAQSRNTQRLSNARAILDSLNQNMIDNNGSLDLSDCSADSIPITSTEIASDGVDICDCVVPVYIAELPVDPETGSYTDCSNYSTGYEISSSTASRITISAPAAELGETIEVTR